MFKHRCFLSFFLIIAVGFAICFSNPTTSYAANNSPEGEEFINFLGNKFIKALMSAKNSHKTRLKKFRPILNDYFDFPKMSRLALGKYWRKATPSEKDEYFKILKEYVAQSYAVRFAEYNAPSFEVIGSKEMKNKDVFVATKISVKQIKAPVRIDWRLKPQAKDSKTKFKIVDIVVEGVSMVISQRSEFSAVIQSNGGKVQSLIDVLTKKTNKIKSQK